MMSSVRHRPLNTYHSVRLIDPHILCRPARVEMKLLE
jgi:hypothetical protein